MSLLVQQSHPSKKLLGRQKTPAYTDVGSVVIQEVCNASIHHPETYILTLKLAFVDAHEFSRISLVRPTTFVSIFYLGWTVQ